MKNIGSVTSDVSVLLFAVSPSAGQNGTPLRSLIAFKRVHLLKVRLKIATLLSLLLIQSIFFHHQPGDSQMVHFPLTAASLSVHDENGNRVTSKRKEEEQEARGRNKRRSKKA